MQDSPNTLLPEGLSPLTAPEGSPSPEVKQVVVVSPSFTMTPEQERKWLTDALKFIAIPAYLYTTYVMGQIDMNGFTGNVFVPTNFIIGSIVTYVGSTFLSFLMKYVPEKTKEL